MSKTTVIAFANNKGGSGKTTTCSNVGCAMAMAGKKAPSSPFGIKKASLELFFALQTRSSRTIVYIFSGFMRFLSSIDNVIKDFFNIGIR